jgi:hypothetical protein
MADTKVSGMPAKATPVAGDIIPILDSAASNANSRTTVGGVRNFLLQPEASHPYRQTFTFPKTTDVAAKYGEAVPWQVETGYSDFAGQTYSDPIFCAGYNVDIALGKKDTNEPGVGYFVESDYYDASAPIAITSISGGASVATVTVGSTALMISGTQRRIEGVSGTISSAVNGNVFTMTVTSATTFTIPLASAGLSGTGGNVTGYRTTELYCQHLETAATAQIRPWFYQIERATNRIITAHIQIPVTNPLAFNLCDGTTTGAGPVLSVGNNALDLYASGADAVLQVRGNATGNRRGILRLGYAGTNAAFEVNAGGTDAADFLINTASALRLYKSGSTGIKASINGVTTDGVLSVNAANTESWSRVFWGRQQSGGNQYVFELQDSTGAMRWSIDSNWNTELGQKSALATTATDGFPYIPTCAGVPTGAATAKTGLVPLVYDTTNNRIYVRNGGTWRQVAVT